MEDKVKLSLSQKLMVFSNCLPSSPSNVDVFFFVQVSFESHPVYDQTQCFNAIFYLFYKYFIIFLLYTFNDRTIFL